LRFTARRTSPMIWPPRERLALRRPRQLCPCLDWRFDRAIIRSRLLVVHRPTTVSDIWRFGFLAVCNAWMFSAYQKLSILGQRVLSKRRRHPDPRRLQAEQFPAGRRSHRHAVPDFRRSILVEYVGTICLLPSHAISFGGTARCVGNLVKTPVSKRFDTHSCLIYHVDVLAYADHTMKRSEIVDSSRVITFEKALHPQSMSFLKAPLGT